MATIIDRRMFAKGFAATAVATGAIALAGCSGEEAPAGSGAASGTSYKIGVLQLTEHSALDAANAGFVKALDDSGITYEIEQQNAQNDQSACQTIAQTLVNDGCDLILAIATPRRAGGCWRDERHPHHRHRYHGLCRLRPRCR